VKTSKKKKMVKKRVRSLGVILSGKNIKKNGLEKGKGRKRELPNKKLGIDRVKKGERARRDGGARVRQGDLILRLG